MSTGVRRRPDEWIEVYKGLRAYWVYNGDPRTRHAELTSGKHSSGFFNSRPIVGDPALLAQVASDMVVEISHYTTLLNVVNRVVGPETGATKLAEAVAAEITQLRGLPCKWASPKKAPDGTLYFEEGQEKVEADEIVLLVEDVITTGGSVLKAAELCMDARATSLEVIGCIVNRSGEYEVGGRKVAALVATNMPTYEPDKCPLCAEGSKPVRPKDNWDELTATYFQPRSDL